MFLKTMRIWSPYSASIRFIVGPTRRQKGHWKSLNSTIETRADSGPLEGAPSVLTV
jgi:hypothetical protein